MSLLGCERWGGYVFTVEVFQAGSVDVRLCFSNNTMLSKERHQQHASNNDAQWCTNYWQMLHLDHTCLRHVFQGGQMQHRHVNFHFTLVLCLQLQGQNILPFSLQHQTFLLAVLTDMVNEFFWWEQYSRLASATEDYTSSTVTVELVFNRGPETVTLKKVRSVTNIL